MIWKGIKKFYGYDKHKFRRIVTSGGVGTVVKDLGEIKQIGVLFYLSWMLSIQVVIILLFNIFM